MSSGDEFTRPATVAEMLHRFDSFTSAEGAQSALDYRPDPGDVFIVTPPKCGTTWMQQIVHGLRSGGSMDFDNINHVVPWIDVAHDYGQDIYADQGSRPHAFKSHSPLDELPRGGKYIVVLRDPNDALLSTYRFFEGTFFEQGSIDLATFAREFYIPAAEVPRHTLAMWGRRSDPDVIAFTFENMLADLTRTVEQVAQFIGTPLDDELRDLVVGQADIGFMKQHESKFDDSVFFDSVRGRMRLPPTTGLSKVRVGQVGGSRDVVPEEIRRQMDSAWRADVAPATGLSSYQDLHRYLVHQPAPLAPRPRYR